MVATASAADYARVFSDEQQAVYPVVDAFEASCGYAIERARLESAARVLACPLKASPPNWQHGRVIYAVARRYLDGKPSGGWTFLDIGTAKGFSALCLQWALMDHAGGAITAGVTSVDVIAPDARVRRNTVAEVEQLRTLREILAPWPEADFIDFKESSGISWIQRHQGRIHVAFVDGKHTGEVVKVEGDLLATRQEPGDIAIFDDVQVEGVGKAVKALEKHYEVEYLRVLPGRAYGIGVRR